MASNISKDFTSRVPVAAPGGKGGGNRSIEAVAAVVPGAQSDTYGVSFAGSSSPENTYLVDGLNVGNPGYGTIGTPLSTEFVKEVSVITGGYMPEYGRTTGGTISAITKSGSNDLHGGVFANFAPGGLAGTPKVPPAGVGAVAMTTKLDWLGDVGGDVGGPIVKDKVWYYAGFDVSSENYNVNRQFFRLTPTAANLASASPTTQHIPGADETNPATATSFQILAKLTWAINPDNKLTGTFIASPTHTGGNNKFSVDPQTGLAQTEAYPNGTVGSTALESNSQSYDASLRWSSEFANKRILLDTIVGYHHEVDTEYPMDGSQFGQSGLVSQPNVTWKRGSPPGYHSITEFENNPVLNAACAVPANLVTMGGPTTLCPVTQSYSTGAPLGQDGHLFTQTYDRYTASSTLTYLLQAAGHHVIKAGLNVETSVSHQDVGSFFMTEDGSGNYIAQNGGFGVLNGPDNPIFGNPLHIKTTSVIAGGFLQDSWSIMDVITANFGVRYDVQQLFNGAGDAVMTLPNQWSPRFGVIYDPTQSGRAKIYANYARYYRRRFARAGQRRLVRRAQRLGAVQWTGKRHRELQQRAEPAKLRVRYKAVAHQRQRAQFAPIAVADLSRARSRTRRDRSEHQADDRGRLRRRGRVRDPQRHASGPFVSTPLARTLARGQQQRRDSYLLPQQRPGYGWAKWLPPTAQSNYDAGTAFLSKTFGDDWLATGSYTLSYLRGNIAGAFLNSGEFDPNHNASFDTKAFTINQQGPLDGDRTHQLKLFGAKDWVFNQRSRLSTGLSFRAMSGTPLTYEAADAIYGCCGLNNLLPRGSAGRTPWEYNVDVNVGYRFAVNRDVSVSASIDIFNLFNFQAAETLNQNYTFNSGLGQQNGTLAQARIFSGGQGRQINSSDVNPNFLLPLMYQQPRYFRFGIRGTF